MQWLIHYLKHEQNWLNDGAILQPHLSVSNTRCPGNLTMPLLAEFRKPWTPPAPPQTPAIVVGPTLEVDMQVTAITVNVPIDNNGKGWLKLPYSIEQILSVTPHSGTRPAADRAYDLIPDVVGLTPEDTGTILVLQGATPNSVTPVWVKVIT